MSLRQLLGGAAVLVVIASAVWYVALSPSRNGEPNSTVQVAVSATATGSGSWVRYLVTVKNLADGDFTGDVLLIEQDEGQQANTSGGPALGAVNQGGAPQLPTAPTITGQSAYQIHVTVPSRHSRTVYVIAPDTFNFVQAVMGGRDLADAQVDRSAVVPIAVLSDGEASANAIVGLRYDQFTTEVTPFNTARGFPASSLLLTGFAAVVIDQFDTASLSEAQVRALRDFVGFGGTLVVAGGTGWRRTLAPLPADLLPIRPTSTASLSLAPIARLAGVREVDAVVPTATGTLAPGARALVAADDGTPLSAQLAYGTGKIVELAFDPSGEAGPTPFAALGWGQALARSLDQQPGNTPIASSLLGPDQGFTALLPLSSDAPLPPIWLMGLVVVLYVVLAGPLNYLLVARRLQRPALFWATLPGVAVVFTGLFYLVGSSLQGTLQDHEIQVVKVGPGQAVNVLEYHRILFLRRGNHEIDPQPESLVAPLTLATFRTTGSTCERCTNQLGGLASGVEHVIPAQRPVVEETGVVYGSVRVVSSSSTARRPAGFDAHLAVHGGRLQGTVTNLGADPVVELEAYSYDGQTQALHRAVLTQVALPGQEVQVDAPLGPVDSPTRAPTAVGLLLRAVASNALAVRGQAVLVGLTAPQPSQLTVDGQPPPISGLAVVQQAVNLSAADSSLRDFQRKWLASAAADPNGGFTDVYDVLVPPSNQPLQLVYNSQWASSTEVYDWSQGAFVPVTAGGVGAQATAPLGPQDIHDGLVRVRMHEPRVSWGLSVWVDAVAPG